MHEKKERNCQYINSNVQMFAKHVFRRRNTILSRLKGFFFFFFFKECHFIRITLSMCQIDTVYRDMSNAYIDVGKVLYVTFSPSKVLWKKKKLKRTKNTRVREREKKKRWHWMYRVYGFATRSHSSGRGSLGNVVSAIYGMSRMRVGDMKKGGAKSKKKKNAE